MTREELERNIGSVASMVKLTCGVANNCAISIMLDAHDQVKRHPAYRQRVKMLYRQALEAWHDYERALLHANHNRFFHVEDMSERTRKKYGDITDRDYFDFWKGLGAHAYTVSRPFVTSLWNKYRLSLINHRVDNPDTLAWAETGSACLFLAVNVWEEAVRQANQEGKIPMNVCKFLFGNFSLKKVLAAWKMAVLATDPTVVFDLEDVEQRNIEAGILQLAELWASPELLYNSTMEALPDFEDIFRTKGEMKKSLREIGELKNATIENLN